MKFTAALSRHRDRGPRPHSFLPLLCLNFIRFLLVLTLRHRIAHFCFANRMDTVTYSSVYLLNCLSCPSDVVKMYLVMCVFYSEEWEWLVGRP